MDWAIEQGGQDRSQLQSLTREIAQGKSVASLLQPPELRAAVSDKLVEHPGRPEILVQRWPLLLGLIVANAVIWLAGWGLLQLKRAQLEVEVMESERALVESYRFVFQRTIREYLDTIRIFAGHEELRRLAYDPSAETVAGIEREAASRCCW